MAKILLIEDDKQLSALVIDFLRGEGHEAAPIYTGPEGLLLLQSGSYDAVILDWELPGLSGPDLCRQYRGAGGDTPILMLTGKRALEEKEEGLDAGADDYLIKPFHLRELSARLRALLRRKASINTAQSTPVADGSIQPGQLIGGKYRLEKFIAQGGMALVYRATHIGMNKQVVVKMLQSHLLTNPKQRLRFDRESQVMARINHVNVASVFDTGVTDLGQPYLVMEYIKGDCLWDYLRQKGPLPLSDALLILDQICKGLEEVHAAGIVHRDLKPENILLQEKKERPDWVKLVDFGISHLVDSESRLTDAGKAIGSVGHMAPEQLLGEPVDCRADIYALGVLLFLMLTNDLPFKAENTRAMCLRQLQSEPDRLSDYLPEFGEYSLVNLVTSKAMARDPEDRYQTVTEIRTALEYVMTKSEFSS